VGWREFEGRERESGPLSKAKGWTGGQEVPISAVAKPAGISEETQGAAAEVMGLPGQAGWHAVGSEQASGKRAMACAGRAAVERTQTQDETPATLARQDWRRADGSAQRMGPEQKDGRQPLRRQRVERHEHGCDGRSLPAVRPPDLARRRRGQTVPTIIGEAN
jgi:hypothetical protein